MSEYGSVIGGVIGAVVGYFAGGNVYQGWVIGSAIGGAWSASKQVIPGPKIGDAQKQWATEGAPIPIVFGYSPPIQGTVVADMREPLIVKTRESGKGGPKVESESAFRTYAIMFCEGESTLRQAWKNGRLVYDATNPAMAADNAAFLEYATWLSGSYDQMPHPALEEIYGVGNAPSFRGRSVLVLDKEDVTDMRGGRNQWHVRVFRGAAKSYTSLMYPAHGTDGVATSAGFKTATLRPQMHVTGNSDSIGTDITFGVATLRAPVVEVDQSDEVSTSITFGVATLRAPVVTIDGQPSEEIETSITFGTGILRPALISHENPAEEIETTITFGEASLYVP